MWTWDSKRQELLFGMGDMTSTYSTDSGNQSLFGYNAATNTWRTVSTYCHAAGQVTPNHPSDYGIMVYDPTRDVVWWNNQGGGFPPGKEGTVCTGGAPGWPEGSIYRNGFMSLNPDTNTWTKVSEQPTWSIGGSYFDVVGDQILSVEDLNNEPFGGTLFGWKVAQSPPLKTTISTFWPLGPTPAWTGSAGGWIGPVYASRVKWSYDDAARIAYLPLVYQRLDAETNVVETGVWMVTVDVGTGAKAFKARAPLPAGFFPDPYMVMSVWDSVNHQLIYSVTANSCAEVKALLAYDPATDTWETLTVPAGLHAGTLGYDPVRNVVVMAGSVFCTDYEQTHLYLWRYGP